VRRRSRGGRQQQHGSHGRNRRLAWRKGGVRASQVTAPPTSGLPAVTGDVTITLDGDGTYPAEQIPELVDHLVDRELDFVSASRFPLKNRRAMNFSNQVGNLVLTVGMAVLYGRAVRDSQSGMWVFRSPVYPKLNVKSDGMAFSEEIKIEAIRHPQVRFGEYPINYHPRVGEVKLQKWRDGFRNLLFLVTKRFA
jgi:hypothetical protein